MALSPQRGFAADRRRAFRSLAAAPNGATEATMLAQGFTVETLGRLVLDGHATATPGGRPITDIGRQALAG
jgi:hypothetical protein